MRLRTIFGKDCTMAIPPRRPRFRATAKTQEKPNVCGTLAVVGQHPAEVQMELFPVAEAEVDGVGMGVLSDGTPYLTLRGLAKLCGVDAAPLFRLVNNWAEERSKPRGATIRKLLEENGFREDTLFVRTTTKGRETHAYTDKVCMAILEYYAFEASQGDSSIAKKNYRLLARASFRTFIYNRCGFDPDKHIADSWRNFRERVLLNDQIPVGYFCVFREIAVLVVHLLHAGCPLDSHTVPDISVGKIWATFWAENDCDKAYGERYKHPHWYPEWFPQAAVNPVDVWIYPNEAMGDFHVWLYRNYIPKNFPKYVQNKVREGVFLPSRAATLIEAMSKRQLRSG